jgi:hypothetical protein
LASLFSVLRWPSFSDCAESQKKFDQDSITRLLGERDEAGRSVRDCGGIDDDDLVEIVRSEVVGYRWGSRACLSARPCADRVVFVVQSLLDGVPAHRLAFQR